jgi:FkbM family methyltransferase
MHHMYLLHRFIVLRLIKQLLNSLRVYGGHLVSDSNDVSQIQFFGRNSFGEKGWIIYIPSDIAITRNILRNGCWEAREVEHLCKVACSNDQGVTLIDLGAHAGLVSLQLRNRCPKIKKFILVEPVPLHVDCINLNFRAFNENVTVLAKALAQGNGVQKGYIDSENRGNFSLEMLATKNRSEALEVETMSASDFSKSLLLEDGKFVIKSDLQGFDSRVLNEFDSKFWERTEGRVIEIWSLENVDETATRNLVRKLTQHFSSWEIGLMDFEPRVYVTPEDLLSRWLDKGGSYTNLFLSK